MTEPYRPKLQPWRASKAGLCANCGGTLLVKEIPPTADDTRPSIQVTCPDCQTEMKGTSQPWHKLSPEAAQAKRRLKAIKDYNDHWRWKAEQSQKHDDVPTSPAVPVAVERLLSQGEVLHQEGRFHDALARAEQALALAPEAAQAWRQKGMVLSDLSQDEAVLRAFAQANALDPTDAIGAALRAIPLYRQGQIKPALDILTQAIAQAPLVQRAKLYHIKGDMLWQVDRAAEALEACDQAVQLDPQDASIHASRGNALLRLERPTEALQAYTQALALDPVLIGAYVGKAGALQQLGREQEAEAALRRAFEIHQEQTTW